MATPKAVEAPGLDMYTLLPISMKLALCGMFADLAIILKNTMSKGVMTSEVTALDATDAMRTLINW